ncbi:unnamed protein product [Ophioblennius macclurei]
MKDIFLLLVLLSAQIVKVSSQPYPPDSDGNCRDKTREYLNSNLCCKKCRPGQMLKHKCNETTDSQCVDCGQGLYLNNWNYYNKCFRCAECKEDKGLEYAQTCSPTTNAKCVCQSGRFCTMEFNNPYCKECLKYKTCKAGFGVSTPGSANSNVRCEPCPDGTFSATNSFTDRCRPHTKCIGGAVVRQGNATSDTVCEHQTTKQTSATVHTTASTAMSTVEVSTDLATPTRPTGSTQHVTPWVSKETPPVATESPSVTTVTSIVLAVGVFGAVFVLIILVLLCFCKRVWRRDSARLQPKVDANGNCQSGDEIRPIYLEASQLTTITVASPEQQCLQENGRLLCSESSQNSTGAETSTRTDCYNSHQSNGHSQSTYVFDHPQSPLSEPMTLLSDSESFARQSSVPSQSSSQPTSPQIISPITPVPHVNVNITLNIGNGSCGAQSCMLTGLKPADCDLPFGEKEECISTPQQEGGKESLMSVLESEGCCT